MHTLNNLDLALVHHDMTDRSGRIITTSVTPIDIHDIARNCKTFGVRKFYVAHPSKKMRDLVRSIMGHWESTDAKKYNPNRTEALAVAEVLPTLQDALGDATLSRGKKPKILGTSARDGKERITFSQARELIHTKENFILLLGTGHGISTNLANQADYFIEPIKGASEYNHLSVRSACAILLDRLSQ
jgi:hypothetical protein